MALETSHTEVEARLLERTLRPGARVLDAGCGRTTRLAGYRDRITELVGVDLNSAAGHENEALDSFVTADLCRRLPFDDGAFDLVYANFVVEHLTDPAAAFREWRRVLQREGALVLLTSNRANPFLAVASLLPHRVRASVKRSGAGVAEEDVIPTHYLANTVGRLEQLLTGAGFTPVDVVCVATLHRYVERKPALERAVRGAERLIPSKLHATIVGCYRPV